MGPTGRNTHTGENCSSFHKWNCASRRSFCHFLTATHLAITSTRLPRPQESSFGGGLAPPHISYFSVGRATEREKLGSVVKHGCSVPGAGGGGANATVLRAQARGGCHYQCAPKVLHPGWRPPLVPPKLRPWLGLQNSRGQVLWFAFAWYLCLTRVGVAGWEEP